MMMKIIIIIIILITTTTTTIIWRFGPFSGHSLPAAGVYRLLSLYQARMSAPRQTQRGEPVYVVSLFVRHNAQIPSGSEDAANRSSDFTGAYKLRDPAKYAFDRVEIPSKATERDCDKKCRRLKSA